MGSGPPHPVNHHNCLSHGSTLTSYHPRNDRNKEYFGGLFPPPRNHGVSSPNSPGSGHRSLPELVPFIPPYDIPPFSPIAQKGFHMLNNRTTAHGDTAGPFLLTDFLSVGDMLDVPQNVPSLCPCHIEENSPFGPRKINYMPDSVRTNCIFQGYIRYFPWPDPFASFKTQVSRLLCF